MPPDPVASRTPAYRALAVTVVTLALAYGVWYAYSVFLVALLKEFGWSRSVLAGAFSVFTLVSGGAGPILGVGGGSGDRCTYQYREGGQCRESCHGVLLVGSIFLT